MANSRSILANPQLRSGCSRTMHIPDIVSQTPLCETAHAQVPIVSEHPTKDSRQLAAERCVPLTLPLRHFSVGKQMLRLNHVPNSCLIVQKRKRPNTDLLFLSGDKPLPSSSANVLRAAGIVELLSQYPNQRFVDTLTSIVTHGIRVGYEGSLSGRTRRPNHSSSYLHVDVIKNSIQSELKKGRIKQVQLPTDYFCSPIGLVPKLDDGIQMGWRVIFDLSSPEGHSVNDGIPKEYGSITYETLNDAIRLVAQAGKGAVMMKRDLKSAFRHIPISPCDYWLLLFEWQGKFYVDMFLPFGLRTAPCIFNLFAEALHWILETLHEWNVTHYLDDFLFVFPPGTDIAPLSTEFDRILSKFGLSKAAEKDSDGCIVVHLGFEFDSVNMCVTLPPNKKQRAVDIVNLLLSSPTVSLSTLESALGFLSHCCQVVPLGRPFLRQLFALLCRSSERHRFHRIRIPHAVKRDLKWWQQFLISWSSISMIQLSRPYYDVATDASGEKGIGGVHRRQIFSERVPARHKKKHINWKEMFAVLHAFLLWHDLWCGGRVRLASDNTAVVDSINKRSIKGPAIHPLQRILLIAAVFDIELLAFWIPSEENRVADAASRHDHEKLANLGLQVSQNFPSAKTLRQKLNSFLATRSHRQLATAEPKSATPMNRSAENMDTQLSLPPLSPSPTGQPSSCGQPNRTRPRATSPPSAPSTTKGGFPRPFSMIPALTLSSGEGNAHTAKEPRKFAFPSLPQSFSESSHNSAPQNKTATSKRHFAWHLPPFYDAENLHGILGQAPNTFPPLQDIMSNSTLTTP